MKKNRFLLNVMLVIFIIFLTGCKASEEVRETPSKLMSIKQFDKISKDIKDYELIANYERGETTQISIRNKISGHEENLLTVDDACNGYLHFEERHNGNLYIIRRSGDTETENWTDELWRYSLDNTITKLYSCKGLDFRVSPNEELIAITNGKFTIIDSQGQIIKDFEKEELIIDEADKAKLVSLIAWSDDSRNLWSCLYDNAVRSSVFEVQSDNWTVSSYSLEAFPMGVYMGDDFDLNPNNGLVAFSNAPVILDVYAKTEFENSNREVSLFIYNPKNQELQAIDITVAKKFNPKWVSNDIIEYDHPIKNERIQYILGK